jgi:cytochrome P450
MMRLTFSIVARCLFNTETQHTAARVDAILKNVVPAVNLSTMLARLVPVALPPLLTPRTRSGIAELHALVLGLIDERRKEQTDRGDLLSMLLAAKVRLYPPAWWADRVSEQACELGGYDIPAGSFVVFTAYVFQRDARVFARPDHFDPERFQPDAAAQIPEGAYLPFGAGVHVCIGSTFALTEAKLILGAMAQRFSIRALRPRSRASARVDHAGHGRAVPRDRDHSHAFRVTHSMRARVISSPTSNASSAV